MSEALQIDSDPKPVTFEILKKWCQWDAKMVSENHTLVEPVIEGGEVVEEGEYGTTVSLQINATTCGFLVEYTLDDGSKKYKSLVANRNVVDNDQELWNSKMEKVEDMTTAQFAAVQKVSDIINEAAKTI